MAARSPRAICKNCGVEFVDTNGRSRYCPKCKTEIVNDVCIDCGKSIWPGYTRCNHCARIYSHETGVYKGKGHKRFEFNSIRYRSSWEVKFAKVLVQNRIRFEYERFDIKTHTYPDFYFHEIDLYVEIHPVHPEKKVIPSNCVLVSTLEDTLCLANILADKTLNLIGREPIDLVMYLRQAILEQEK